LYTGKVPAESVTDVLGDRDGRNTVSWRVFDDDPVTGTETPAMAHTMSWYSGGGRIVEADIELDKEDCPHGDVAPKVILHEFGHALGLGHSSVVGAVMHTAVSFAPIFTLQQDDIDGVVFLYPPVATMELNSDVFVVGGAIPKKYTSEGENVSPPLRWEGAPAQAKEFAVVCWDQDAPGLDPFVHWVLLGIDQGTASLAEGDGNKAVAAGGTQGRNDLGTFRYEGPAPSEGDGPHHYHFRIYALDQPLVLEGFSIDWRLLVRNMNGHILAEGELVGVYTAGGGSQGDGGGSSSSDGKVLKGGSQKAASGGCFLGASRQVR
jgi:Raf kinase inhibitor-like YbhB/YbcL family protein